METSFSVLVSALEFFRERQDSIRQVNPWMTEQPRELKVEQQGTDSR